MKTISLCIAATVFLLAGCGGGSADDAPPAETASPCEAAFASAAQVDEMQDTGADLVPAFTACKTLAEFEAASKTYPKALDGPDPELVATTRCQDAPVSDSPLCRSIG